MKTNIHLSYGKVVALFRLLWRQLQEHGDKEPWRLEFHSDGPIEVWSGRFGMRSSDTFTIKTPSDVLREYIEHEEAEGRTPDWSEAQEWLVEHFNLPTEGEGQ